MTSMEAFLGTRNPITRASRNVRRLRSRRMSPRSAMFGDTSGVELSMAQIEAEAAKFATPTITADVASLRTHGNVVRLQQAIAEDRAEGSDFSYSMQIFLRGLKAVKQQMTNILDENKNMKMTDDRTQRTVDQLALVKIFLEIIEQEFPEGIPEAEATQAEDYVAEINDLADQLAAKRAVEYEQANLNLFNAQQGYAPGTPVGGGVVEKTTMQKYGPVAALAAGGLAAYLALR